jgi:hypothetical protein
LVSYEDWKKHTSALFKQRGKELAAVDVALQDYEVLRNQKNLQRVKDAFSAWKRSKGPNDAWKGGTRDKNQYATLLDQQLSGVGDTDILKAGQEFMAPALVNSRLGVTYLFANLECEETLFKVVLSGAIDLTSTSLDFAAGSTSGTTSTALGYAKTGVTVGGKGADLAADKIAARMKAKPAAPTAGAAVVTSAQLTAVVSPPNDSKLRAIYKQITEYIQKTAKQLLETIRKKIGNFLDDPIGGGLPQALRKLCDLLTGKFLATAAPFIGASLDFVGGVCRTIDASVKTFNSWLAGRDVVLMAGHPSTIANAIHRAMAFSIGEGLYDTVKGGVKLGLEIASSGAATIASLVSSIVETLVKTIWRVVEIERMKRFFEEAREHWRTRSQANALQNRPIEFNNWFKRYALAIPALAVLSLNTGICGDKMHFLQMFKDDNHVISQSEFDAGCTYVDGLKVWGSEYLGNAGFSFASDDKVVSGLLKLAKNHKEEAGAAGKAWQFALGFLKTG